VIFKDFDIGQVYKKVVKITNTSIGRTSFRLLEVPAEHATILNAQQEVFGFLPAGLATKVTIVFTPSTDVDILTHLDVLTDKGLCKLPVSCLCKKAELSVHAKVIDMGFVTVGQCKTQQIVIENTGALEVTVSAQL
jgi:hypothetical protein